MSVSKEIKLTAKIDKNIAKISRDTDIETVCWIKLLNPVMQSSSFLGEVTRLRLLETIYSTLSDIRFVMKKKAKKTGESTAVVNELCNLYITILRREDFKPMFENMSDSNFFNSLMCCAFLIKGDSERKQNLSDAMKEACEHLL